MAQAKRERTYTRQLVVRLEESVWEDLTRIAEKLETNTTKLVRDWVGERLRIELESGAGAPLEGRLNPNLERHVRQEMITVTMQSMPTHLHEIFTLVRDQMMEDVLAEQDSEEQRTTRLDAPA